MKKSKSSAEQIVENLIKLTTVPIEKSVIKWRMDKVFNQYNFEAEYKGKIYRFDGRHFYVYPAGHELPPGIRIGDKSGPELLLNVRINTAPKEFGDLWRVVCGQHERELAEDRISREKEMEAMKIAQEKERNRISENTKQILNDFK